MSDFESTRKAFMMARERADIASSFEWSTLHAAVCDTRESGMSKKETATALRVPKSTVARHWRGTSKGRNFPPLWGSPRAWREAHEVIWAHDPSELADTFIPYEWNDIDGKPSVRARPRGVAVLRNSGDGAAHQN